MTRSKTLVLSIVALLGWALVPVVASVNADALALPAQYRAKFLNTPCKNLGSNECYFNAAKRGGTFNHSFYAINIGAHRECIRYWNRTYGRSHDFCGPR